MLLKIIISKESLIFAMFPLVYNFVLQSFTILLKKYLKNENIVAFISGFVAGFFSLMTK